jgi:hypothetical protein
MIRNKSFEEKSLPKISAERYRSTISQKIQLKIDMKEQRKKEFASAFDQNINLDFEESLDGLDKDLQISSSSCS